jgi:hypothetical protein
MSKFQPVVAAALAATMGLHAAAHGMMITGHDDRVEADPVQISSFSKGALTGTGSYSTSTATSRATVGFTSAFYPSSIVTAVVAAHSYGPARVTGELYADISLAGADYRPNISKWQG